MKLEVKNISKAYKDVKALKKVNLSFTPGVWGLLGANGAGKSTLMEILVGNKAPTNGSIFLDGRQVGGGDREYRSCIGYLPQNFSSGAGVTVADYLEYMAALKDVPKTESRRRIRYLLELLELSQYRKKQVGKLSGGTRQRVGIAQALLNDPLILVLDEPTSGLDPKERIRLRSIISKMGKDKIVILSTHIVSDIESIANQNVILKKGRLIDAGTTGELLGVIEEKVWEAMVPAEAVEAFEADHTVINIRTTEKNSVAIRFISEEPGISGAKMQEPKLEDYYLWILKQNEGGRKVC